MNRLDPTDHLLLTTGGLGHRRPASGTWGSIPPVVVAAFLLLIGVGPLGGMTGAPWIYSGILAFIAIAFSIICITAADSAEAAWGKDPSPVVADETAGMALALLIMPPAFTAHWTSAAAALAGAFFLFRFFDIAKLPPAGRMQHIPGGWGILLDDHIAAIQTGITMWLIAWLAF